MLLAILTILTMCYAADANDTKLSRPETLRQEPAGRVITHEGVKYKAFTLDEWKEHAHIIVDYRLLWDYSLSLELDIKSFEADIKVWEMRVALWKETAESQKERGDILSSMFDAEHELRLKIERQHRATNWIPWALVVVESIAFGVVSVIR